MFQGCASKGFCFLIPNTGLGYLYFCASTSIILENCFNFLGNLKV
jgi:hypothetical protein